MKIKTAAKTNKAYYIAALLIIMIVSFCISAINFNAFADMGSDIVYDNERGVTEITLESANNVAAPNNSLKKMFDYWNDSNISFTNDGVLSTAEKNANAFNLIGVFSIVGNGLEMEVNLPLRDSATGEFVDETRKADNFSVILFSGTIGSSWTELAKLTVFANSYRAENPHVMATINVGSYELPAIKIPKSVVEVGGKFKLGFTVADGWSVDTVTDNQIVYQRLPMTTDYRAALDAIGVEEVPRVQITRALWSTGNTHLPKILIKSVNSQSFIPANGKLVLSDLWAASDIKLNTNYEIGKEYTFTLNATGANNNLSESVQPADAHLLFFSAVVGNVGWNSNGSAGVNTLGGIYVKIIDPDGNATEEGFTSSWGHLGSEKIAFTFNKSGENTLVIRIATNIGYTLTKSVKINVEPIIVLDGEIRLGTNGFILPECKLIGEIGGAEIIADKSVVLSINGVVIDKTGDVYPFGETGKYTALYKAVVGEKEYTYEYSFYFDGESIMSKQITVSTLFSDNAVLQKGKSIKIFGEGGDNGSKVFVEYDGQKKEGIIENSAWEVYLDPMEYNDGKTLKITYGAQIIEIDNVAVGEVFLCSGQSNMQISVSYILGKDNNIKAEYQSLGEDFSNISIFSVPAVASAEKLTALSDSYTWVKPTGFEDLGAYSAYAVAFAQNLQAMSGVKIGVIVAAVGGSWIEEWLEEDSFARVADNSTKQGRPHSRYFNGMINPVLNYEIGGILWYQGESNASTAASKDYLAQTLEYASSYRKLFRDNELKIVITQLVQYAFSDYMLLRDIQWQAMFDDENLFTVCAIDTGDASNGTDTIHPSDKWIVGEKAAGLVVDKVLGIAYDDLLYKASYGVAPYIQSAVLRNGVLTAAIANATELNKADGEYGGIEIYYDNQWNAANYRIENTNFIIETNNKEVTKLRYLQSRIVPEGTALIYNEYGNAVAPCLELKVDDGKVFYDYSVVIEGLGVVTPKSGKVEAGHSVEFIVAPAENYRIEQVLVNGESATVVKGVLTVENVSQNITVQVKFAEIKEDVKPSGGCNSNITFTIGACIVFAAVALTLIKIKAKKY